LQDECASRPAPLPIAPRPQHANDRVVIVKHQVLERAADVNYHEQEQDIGRAGMDGVQDVDGWALSMQEPGEQWSRQQHDSQGSEQQVVKCTGEPMRAQRLSLRPGVRHGQPPGNAPGKQDPGRQAERDVHGTPRRDLVDSSVSDALAEDPHRDDDSGRQPVQADGYPAEGVPAIEESSVCIHRGWNGLYPTLAAAICALLLADTALGHNVSAGDARLIAGSTGPQLLLYAWLGAKHMVTGYDHLLFLLGVIFYLRTLAAIAIYVSLFALGHSITLILGVLLGLDVNPYLVDAVIGLSVAYKGFDNLRGFETLFGDAPDTRIAVLVFGLFHGLGLATKLRDLGLREDGLLVNLVSFNVGVELGQLAALAFMLFLLRYLRRDASGSRVGLAVNAGLVVLGFALMTYQLGVFWTAQGLDG